MLDRRHFVARLLVERGDLTMLTGLGSARKSAQGRNSSLAFRYSAQEIRSARECRD
jgi:hypothetical protein